MPENIKVGLDVELKSKNVAKEMERVGKLAKEALDFDSQNKSLLSLLDTADKVYASINKSNDALKTQQELETAITLQQEAQEKLNASLGQRDRYEKKLTEYRNIGDTKNIEKYQGHIASVSEAIAGYQQIIAEFGTEIENLNAKLDEMKTTGADINSALTFEDSATQASGLLDVLQQIETVSNEIIQQSTVSTAEETTKATSEYENLCNELLKINSTLPTVRENVNNLVTEFMNLGNRNLSDAELNKEFIRLSQSANATQTDLSAIIQELERLYTEGKQALPADEFEKFNEMLVKLWTNIEIAGKGLIYITSSDFNFNGDSIEESITLFEQFKEELETIYDVYLETFKSGGMTSDEFKLFEEGALQAMLNQFKQADSAIQELKESRFKLVKPVFTSENPFLPPRTIENLDTANYSVMKLIHTYNELKQEMSDFMNGKLDLNDEEFRELQQNLAQAKADVKALSTEMTSASSNSSQFAGVASRIGRALQVSTSVAKSFGSAIAKAFKNGITHAVSFNNAIGSRTLSALKKIKSAMDKAFSGKSLKKGLTTLLKYTVGVRSLYFAFRKLRNMVKEGLENLVQYQSESNETNKAITAMNTSLLYLKNAWASAFAPIINYCMPLLTMLIDGLANTANAIARFIGSLTGQTQVLNAVKVDAQDYAESLKNAGSNAGGAADKVKKLTDRLASFDDLNVLGKDNDDSGSGGGGSGLDAYVPDPNDMFEYVDSVSNFADMLKSAWEKADFSEIGEMFKDKIIDALKSIKWEDIQAEAEKIGKSIGTFLAGFFGDPELFTEAGKTVGEGINTIIYGIQSLLQETKGVDFGGNLAQGLNEFLNTTDFKQAGENIGDVFTQITDNINSFLDTISTDKISTAISDFIKGLDLPKMLQEAGKTSIKLICTAIEVSEQVIQQLGEDLGDKLTIYASSNTEIEVPSGDGKVAMEVEPVFDWTENPILALFDKWVTELGSFVVTDIFKIDDSNFDEFYTNWMSFIDSLTGIGDAIMGAGEAIKSYFAHPFEVASQNMEKAQELWDLFWSNPFSGLEDLGINVDEIMGFFDNVKLGAETVGEALDSLWDSIVEGSKPIYDSLTEFGEEWDRVWGLISEMDIEDFLLSVGDWVSAYIITPFVDFGTNIIEGLQQGITDAINGIGEWMNTYVVEPICKAFCDLFGINSPSTVFLAYGTDLIQGLLNGVNSLIEDVTAVFTQLSTDLVGIWTTIKTDAETNWNTLKTNITSAVENAKSTVTTKVEEWKTNLSDAWYNIRTTAVSGFWTMKTKIVEAFDALKENIKAPVNGIIGVVEDMVNFVIRGINKLLGGLNQASEGLGDIASKVGLPTITISTLPEVSLPRLAQGAVIPPNREFMAVLGDQTSGTNIEAPLDTIKQAVAEELSSQIAVLTNGFESVVNAINNKDLTIGDKDIGKANARYTQQQKMIRGVNW